MAKILIDHGWIIPMSEGIPSIPDGAVAIDNDRIAAVGARNRPDLVAFLPDKVIDASGKAVLPGLVNTHTHTISALNKGTSEDAIIPSRRAMLFQENCVQAEDVYFPGLLHGIEMVRTGTTCANDMWWHQPQSALVARDLGMRTIVGGQVRELNTGLISADRVVRDWDGDLAKRNLDEAEKLIQEWHGYRNGLITCRVAPDAPDRCSEDTLMKCRELATKYDVGLHIHTAANPAEQGFMIQKYGKRSFVFLEDLGLLGPKTVAVHCVFIDDSEIDIIKRTDTKISHTPYLVAKRGYFPPMEKVYQANIDVSLGSDWMSDDMWKIMRSAIIVARVLSGNRQLISAYDALYMATLGGAKCLGLDHEIGSLEAGKKADLILLDLMTPWCAPIRAEDLISTIIYNANGSDVTDVIIDGNVVVEAKRMLTVDEKAVIREAQRISTNAWSRARDLFNLNPVQ